MAPSVNVISDKRSIPNGCVPPLYARDLTDTNVYELSCSLPNISDIKRTVGSLAQGNNVFRYINDAQIIIFVFQAFI